MKITRKKLSSGMVLLSSEIPWDEVYYHHILRLSKSNELRRRHFIDGITRRVV